MADGVIPGVKDRGGGDADWSAGEFRLITDRGESNVCICREANITVCIGGDSLVEGGRGRKRGRGGKICLVQYEQHVGEGGGGGRRGKGRGDKKKGKEKNEKNSQNRRASPENS